MANIKRDEDKDSAYRAAQLAATIARAYPAAEPHHIANAVVALRCVAAASRKHSENTFNYPLTGPQIQQAKARIDRLVTRATELMDLCAKPADGSTETPPAYKITTSGDPRGPCAWLKIGDMPGDGWDREAGFAIY